MNTIKVQQVIVCTKERRGDGKYFPIRSLIEVFDFDGKLIAEYDPNSFTIEEIYNFLHGDLGLTSENAYEAIGKHLLK